MPDREKNKSIENNFTYHPPIGDQQSRYELLRDRAKELAYFFDTQCPPSREKSLAITKLEEAVMWANAAIARNEKPVDNSEADQVEAQFDVPDDKTD